MKYYDIIPLSEIRTGKNCHPDKTIVNQAVSSLNTNIEDERYQWVFQPVEVLRFGINGLRAKDPPFYYQIVGGDIDKYCIHLFLGLHSIRCHIDTTFADDGPDKGSPFPRKWRDNLGYPKGMQPIIAKINEEEERKWKQIEEELKKEKIEGIAKVAVILTSYNRPNLVQKAIKSVLSQTYHNFRLYIVDNNSHENVKNILLDYKQRFPDKIILHFLNTQDSQRTMKCWLSYMINWAIKEGNEPFITLLTDDCWFHPERLMKMVSFMELHPEHHICYGSQAVVNQAGITKYIRRANTIIQHGHAGGRLDHNSVMFRRELIDKIGYWNESPQIMLAPDAEFWNRIPFPIIPIGDIITDYFLDHHKRFQHFLKTPNRLKSGEIME